MISVPQYADIILKVAAKMNPKQVSELASTAVQLFPTSEKTIVQLVTSVVPGSKSAVEQAVATAPKRRMYRSSAAEGISSGAAIQLKRPIDPTSTFPNGVPSFVINGTDSYDPKRYD